MGNREALLAGAQRCLFAKGYARTTARDIATASGVSLAAIGYHFGSTQALLRAALLEATNEWGDELEHALAGAAEADADSEADADPGARDPIERFELTWTRLVESFTARRQLWATQFELFAQLEHDPEVRQFFADALERARFGLAAMLQGLDPDADRHAAKAAGGFHQALLSGMLLQWLADPERAPTGRDLADALRLLVTHARPESALAPAGDGIASRQEFASIRPRQWSETDLAELPDDGHRYEILDGNLLATAPAHGEHQRVVEALLVTLRAATPTGWRIGAGEGVRVPGGSLRPDLAAFAPGAVTDAGWTTSGVGLVVEVETDQSRDLDRGSKAIKYARAGVPAYWRVDVGGTLFVEALVAPERYGIVAEVKRGEKFEATVPFAVTIQ
ncbi:Uma2 family endonuclease [Actinopolymorpha pittospori]|uniref:AcrR family transcriptional regulator n=1 Tax=Actinopolymorpha pittospori TaxID=648752 RepID=A0A927N1J9_9ACTN|nr:Uma2 family endonuclease [Actinopolymorpha pittospori]MBE1610434.1 AcrR family transcriptional regulator [Actinopolymorpha pittospori]